MTHTESLIKDYEAAIRVMETLPAVHDAHPADIEYTRGRHAGRCAQRQDDLTELRRRLAVMKQWRPGMRWEFKPHNLTYWTPSGDNPIQWSWDTDDYRPAPEPPKPPCVVWMRPRTICQTLPSDYIPHDYVFSPVMPDGPGWTRYTIAEEGGTK